VMWFLYCCCCTVQVLQLCAVIAPNHDITFVLSVTWTAIQLLCSSYYISFTVVSLAMCHPSGCAAVLCVL
jgi:hypothetical protein